MKSLLTEWTGHQGGYLHQKFAILHNRLFDNPEDAQALCAALRHERANELDADDEPILINLADPAWFTIAWTMYRVDSQSVVDVIRSEGLPELTKRLEQALDGTAEWTVEIGALNPAWRCLNGRPRHFLFLISLLALYGDRKAVDCVSLAARHDILQRGGDRLHTLSSWPTVFSCIRTSGLDAVKVIELLRKPLPEGKAAEGFLGFSNDLLQDTELNISHPFDTPEGLMLLHHIADQEEVEPDEPTAELVADALPFLRHSGRELLLQKLINHPNKHVRSAALKASRRGWS